MGKSQKEAKLDTRLLHHKMNEYSEASIALEDKVLSSDIEAKGDRGRSQIGIQEEEKQKCFSIGITKGKQNNLQRTKRGGIIK